MIEYVPISIAKKEYQPELSTLNEPDAYRLKENNKCRVVSEIWADYLIEEWNKDFIKRMEGYKNASTMSRESARIWSSWI